MNVSGYINVLREKAFAWLSTSERAESLLILKDYDSLEIVLSQREIAINGYLDCLDRLESKVTSLEKVETGEKFLINLLDHFTSIGNDELRDDLLAIKKCFESIRDVDSKLQKLAEGIPEQMRQNLLDFQKKKPAVTAYQRTKFNPLNQFKRFDRSE